MSLDYLSCFAVVLRGIDRKVDIYQADYSTTPKKFTVFWSHTWNYNIQANERLTKVKEKWLTIDLSFISFIPVTQTVSGINKWCMLFFLCIRLVAHVLAHERAIPHIKLRRLSGGFCYMVIFCIQNIHSI